MQQRKAVECILSMRSFSDTALLPDNRRWRTPTAFNRAFSAISMFTECRHVGQFCYGAKCYGQRCVISLDDCFASQLFD